MRILVIPGIGDVHWVMLKMQSFIEKHCPGEKPEIWVWNFDGRPRSADFIKKIPFVTFGGYWDKGIEVAKETFDAAYFKNERQLVKDFQGFDYFFCVNGGLRIGKNFETEVLPEYKVNWDYPLDLSGIPQTTYKNYVLCFFSEHGMFGNWVKTMPVDKIRRVLKAIQNRGYNIILSGAHWDADFNKKLEMPGVINLTGQTSLDDLLSLIQGCECFVGWCGGNTIIAPHMGKRTLMIWNNYFKEEGFYTNWVKPANLNTLYRPVLTHNKHDTIVRAFEELNAR